MKAVVYAKYAPPDVLELKEVVKPIPRDMGIAMCHFELTARELGLKGNWIVAEPVPTQPGDATGYVATWVEADDRGSSA